MKKTALYVFIEGADGVGKSSVTNALLKDLAAAQKEITATHVIKHTQPGMAFYNSWVNGTVTGLNAALNMLAVTAATLENIQQGREEYDIIVVDRSQASFFAYQLNNGNVRTLLEPAYEETLKADFYKNCNFTTIYLHCDSQIAIDRMKHSRSALDAIESLGPDYQDTVKKYYDECFALYESLRPGIKIDTGLNDQVTCSKIAFDFVMKQLELRTK